MRLSVVLSQHRLSCLYLHAQPSSFSDYEMVMWDLQEEMVDDMSPDVMVDVVDPSIVLVERHQATLKIGPFLAQ